jgi:hypothetical protein
MMKKNYAFCRSLSSFMQDLNNGRPCHNHWQCKTQLCHNDFCKGRTYGDKCHSHVDCEPGLFCQTSLYWPWESQCEPYRKTGDSCNEDFDCLPKDFCWYSSEQEKIDGVKTCIELWSRKIGSVFGWFQKGSEPTQEDYQQNGKVCHAGLAIPMSKN